MQHGFLIFHECNVFRRKDFHENTDGCGYEISLHVYMQKPGMAGTSFHFTETIEREFDWRWRGA